MLQELQSLSLKKSRIQFLKKQHATLTERIRLEIERHNWQQEHA